MAGILRIKRRSAAGAAGAPSSLAAAEIAYNEKDDILYYGKGDSGGMATNVIPIAGPGVFGSVSGAPLDALAFNGIQHNCSMDVSQERANTAFVFTTAVYANDSWVVGSTGTQQVGCFPQGNGASPPGFLNHLYIYTNVANAAPATGHLVSTSHAIEGYRMARLAWGTANASPITLGFWVQAIRAGLASGSIRNATVARSYVFSFTINAANTWEYKTVTIPGDTTGTWEKTTGIGMYVGFAVMSGTTYLTTAGAWTAGNFVGVTGTSNFAAAVSDTYRITGVVVLPGSSAPTAAQSPLIMRPYDQELRLCQRYYYRRNYVNISTWIGVLQAYTTAAASGPLFNHPVTMRTAPTVTPGGTFQLYNANGTGTPINGGTYGASPDFVWAAGVTSTSVLRAGDAVLFGNSTANAFHDLNARL